MALTQRTLSERSGAALEDLLEARERGARLLLRNPADDHLRGRRAERTQRGAELVAVVEVRQPVADAQPMLGDRARARRAAALPAGGLRRSHYVQDPVH